MDIAISQEDKVSTWVSSCLFCRSGAASLSIMIRMNIAITTGGQGQYLVSFFAAVALLP
jgi:hypothetical protein